MWRNQCEATWRWQDAKRSCRCLAKAGFAGEGGGAERSGRYFGGRDDGGGQTGRQGGLAATW
eukprot:9244614-Pyramimonas_sp.AAC.1